MTPPLPSAGAEASPGDSLTPTSLSQKTVETMEKSVRKNRPSPVSSSSSTTHTIPASSSSGVCTPHTSPMPPPFVAFSALAYSKMVMHGIKHTQDAVNGILLGRVIEEEEEVEFPRTEEEKGKSKREEKKKRTTFFCIDVIPLFHTYILPPMMDCAFEIVEEMCRELNGRIAKGRSMTRAGESSRSPSGASLPSSCPSPSTSPGKKEEEKTEKRREDSKERKTNTSGFRSKRSAQEGGGEGCLSIIGSYHHSLLLPPTPEEPATPSYIASMVAGTIHSKIPQSILCMMQLRRLTGGGRGGKAGGVSKETGDHRFANASCACVYYCGSGAGSEGDSSSSTKSGSKWRRFDSPGEVAVTATAQMISQSAIQDATYMSLKDMDDHLFDPSLSPLNASLLSGYEPFLERDFRELREVYGLKIDGDDPNIKQLLGL